MLNNSQFWSTTHSDPAVLKDRLNFVKPGFNSDIEWLKFQLNNCPNGKLLMDNMLFDIPQGKKKYLAHVTKNLDAVLQSGRLLSSSGCLIGSVYCVPVTEDEIGLRLHNLGEYIVDKEAPAFSQNSDKVGIILVELESTSLNHNSVYGVNYLKLGEVHFSVFSELSYLLSTDELEEIKSSAVDSIHKSYNILSIFEEHSSSAILSDFDKFYNLYQSSVPNLPILGYLLFEVLCEYIALYQKSELVDKYALKREIYCANFKDLIFSVCPDLTKSFNLGKFNPDLEKLKDYLEKIGLFSDEMEFTFKSYLVERLRYLVLNNFYNSNTKGEHEKIWHNVEWSFDYIKQHASPLLGNTIHRLLRNMKRYPNFYFYFDQYKALQVWNYWNQMGVALPYNSILPKGEIGINPANANLKYKTYTAKAVKKDGFTYLEKQEEVSLIIEPRLAELDFLLMRKK